MAKPEIEINVKLNDADRERVKKELRELTPEQEFSYGSKDMANEIRGLIEQYNELATQSSKVTKAYRAEYAALNENAQGYADQKKELEALILQGEKLEGTLVSNRVALEKQAIALKELKANAGKLGIEDANRILSLYGLNVGKQAQAYEIVEQKLSNLAEVWQNKLLKTQEEDLIKSKEIQKQLELQGKTYSELTELYLDLLQTRKGAKTAEEIKDIEKNLSLVRKQLAFCQQELKIAGQKSVGFFSNIRTISLLQQAEAARRLGSVLNDLGGQFSSLAENARNGNLNLTSMVSSVVTLGYTMQASLAPITAIVLCVELLQGAWNAYAASAQRAKDAERDVQATMALSETAYKNAAIAKEKYLQKKSRDEEIEALRMQYVDLNDEIARGLDLVNRTTKAEIARLALVEDEQDHKETLEKAELGRKLESGEISDEEYQKALINLNKQNKERKAKATVDQAKLSKQEAEKKLEIARSDYAEKERLTNEQELYLNQFLSEEEIDAIRENYEKLTKKREEKAKSFREADKRQTDSIWGGLGGFDAIKLDAEVKALKRELHAVDSAIADYESFLQDTIGTTDIKDYASRRADAKEKYDIAKREQGTASDKVEASYNANIQAEIELEETQKKSRQEINQAKAFAQSELETMQVKAEAKKQQAKLDAQYRQAQKELKEMTNDEIDKARQELDSRRQTTKNHKELESIARLDSMYKQELENNIDKGKATVREVRRLASLEKNSITRWADENVETYANGRITESQAQELISRMDKALQTRSQVDDKVMKALSQQVSFTEKVTTSQQREIQRLQRELNKSQRQAKFLMKN